MNASAPSSPMLDRSVGDAATLRRIAATLDDAQWPATRWLALSNDESFGPAHRRVAASELLRRHVRPGATLGAVAQLTAGAKWIDAHSVRVVEDIAGRPPPLALAAGGTVVAIDIWPANDAAPAVFLRLTGDWPRNEVVRTLLGASTPASAAVVAELAVRDA